MAPDAHPATMTPEQAAATLADLHHYEERLTAKAHGITSMVWGLAIAGIFLAYNAASPVIEAHGAHWANAIIWIPFVAIGITVTGAVWNQQAISLRRDPETKRGLATSLAYTIGFFLLMAATYGLRALLFDGHWDTNLTMLAVTGLFAIAIGALQGRKAACGPPTIGAGIALLALAFALADTHLSADATGLIGAGAAAAAYVLPGLWAILRG